MLQPNTQTQTGRNRYSMAAVLVHVPLPQFFFKTLKMAGLFQIEYTKGTAKTGVTFPNLLYKANNLGQ